MLGLSPESVSEMTKLQNKNIICIVLVVAFCYLYTGSAYMSQFYRLMNVYDDAAVDMITSFYFYLLQAAGLSLSAFLFWKNPSFVCSKTLLIILLSVGAVFMLLAQLLASPLLMVLFACAFNFFIGIYTAFYLTLFGLFVPARQSGLFFGIAYAFGSVGTYLLSLAGGGSFLQSKEISALYLLLCGLVIALVLLSPYERKEAKPKVIPEKQPLFYQLSVITLMCVISVLGSGLYYSLPSAHNINWNLIRAFYAAGLILAGFLIDKKRFIGEVIVLGSLTYPLIATSLMGNGVAGTVAMGFSYAFRGFLTIYYVTAFTDYASKDPSLAYLAPLGLFVSRLIEALLTLLLIRVPLSPVFQLIFCAACFIPLLILFVFMQQKRYPAKRLTDEDRLFLFSEKHQLTARESEILKSLAEGLSDSEIAEKCFISKNTVRFHVSNIMKKTQTTSRVEVVRALRKTE